VRTGRMPDSGRRGILTLGMNGAVLRCLLHRPVLIPISASGAAEVSPVRERWVHHHKQPQHRRCGRFFRYICPEFQTDETYIADIALDTSSGRGSQNPDHGPRFSA